MGNRKGNSGACNDSIQLAEGTIATHLLCDKYSKISYVSSKRFLTLNKMRPKVPFFPQVQTSGKTLIKRTDSAGGKIWKTAMLKKTEWIILAEIRSESALQHHSKTAIFAFYFIFIFFSL